MEILGCLLEHGARIQVCRPRQPLSTYSTLSPSNPDSILTQRQHLCHNLSRQHLPILGSPVKSFVHSLGHRHFRGHTSPLCCCKGELFSHITSHRGLPLRSFFQDHDPICPKATCIFYCLNNYTYGTGVSSAVQTSHRGIQSISEHLHCQCLRTIVSHFSPYSSSTTQRLTHYLSKTLLDVRCPRHGPTS